MIFKRIAMFIIHQWIRLNELYKLIESCLQTYGKLFSNFEFISTKNKVRILIKFYCVKYQWIRLDKLYKLMESFISNFGIIFRINYNYLK